MAASFGETLLGEVHHERLDELLHHLRVFYYENVDGRDAPNQCLGVASIDELLEAFMPSRPVIQSSDQLQTDSSARQNEQDEFLPGQSDSEPHQEPPHNPAFKHRVDPVIEISSTSSAAGKSQLLYYLAATAILPSQLNGVPLPGLDSAVVFIDTDGRFDAERLLTVAGDIAKIAFRSKSGAGADSTLLKSMLFSSLQHVHVFRPQSSLSLLATLKTLDTYLLDLPRHVSSKRPLHSILIDSATAFFWQDKLQDEIARVEDIGRTAADIERERRDRQSFYITDLYVDLVTTLKRLQRLFDCVVVYTAVSGTGRPIDSRQYDSYNPLDMVLPGLPAFRSPLPAPWSLFPTLRLVTQRDAVRPFPPAMMVDEARRDAPMRQEVVERGKFVGWVNGWGRGDWPRQVMDGVKRRNGGQFTFRIRDEGVAFD